MSPRALAAHALTGFRYTKDMVAAGGAGAGSGIWPALGATNAARVVGQDRADGDGKNGAAAAPSLNGGGGGNGGDLGGLASLSLAHLANTTTGFQLAMLGMLPGYGSLLGSLPAAGQRQQQQQLQTSALQGAGTSPQAQLPSQQKELPVLHSSSTAPHSALLDLPKPPDDLTQQEARPAELARAATTTTAAAPPSASSLLASTAADGAITGPVTVDSDEPPASSASPPAVPAAPAAVVAQGALPQPDAHTHLAATVEAGVGAGAGAVPVHALPPKSTSQALNLLAISQELQEAVGSARSAAGIRGPISAVGSSQRGGFSEVGGGRDVENGFPASQRFRMASVASPSKLRRSCDRCTMRKIKCDGSGIICKR